MDEEEVLTADLEADLEAFTCALFGYPKLNNEARHENAATQNLLTNDFMDPVNLAQLDDDTAAERIDSMVMLDVLG